MTIDSMLENDQRGMLNKNPLTDTTTTSGKSRKSVNISLTRKDHEEKVGSFHSRKNSKTGCKN